MKNVKLANGVEMPILGFGVFQIPDAKECYQAVTDALEVGYRHFDTAAIYRNEKAVGDAIKDSGVKREELFITTKLWIQDADEHRAIKAFEKSLDKLSMDYLDLYLIHQPFGDLYGAWRALEKLYKQERTRAIGVSNFYPDRLADLIVHNEIAPMVNQIETHPFFQRADYQVVMAERGVQLESWAPFAQGRNDLFSHPVLAKIADAHGRPISQVVLRWMIQRNVVVIPKTVHKERMSENFDVFGFELTESDMSAIAALDTGASVFLDHRTVEAAEGLGAHTAEL
jgi:diketogulonate reductase-like aldo/keto reductase